MKNNPEQNNILTNDDRPEKRARYSAAQKSLLALVMSASILMPGCKNVHVLDQPKPVIEDTENKAPSAEQLQEVIPVKGINGEYFSNVPTWEQNFDNSPNNQLDDKQWNIYEGAPEANSEAEYYTDNPKNIRIENGVLIIEAHNEAVDGYKYTSARIDTQGKQEFKYGKFEIEAKLPKGVGTWPAVWLSAVNQENNPDDDFDPANPRKNGELDIIEAVGFEPNVVYAVAHSQKDPDDVDHFSTIKIPDCYDKFHTYGFEWTPKNLTYYVDGKPFYVVNKKEKYKIDQWPYDRPFNFVANLALGGAWGGEKLREFPPDGVDGSALPARMEINRVSYYKYMPDNRPEIVKIVK